MRKRKEKEKKKKKTKLSLEDKVDLSLLCSIIAFIFMLLLEIIYFIICIIQAI